MKILDRTKVIITMCILAEKYGMYISFIEQDNIAEIIEAAPYLDFSEHHQIFMDGHGWILFDSEEEMIDCYEKTVGDDGPTKSNPYNGKIRVYAVTCSPKGELMNENT
jgi:hypothetical protein